MAILVAVGGAALGSAVGLGWQAGWLVGSVVGNLLFPTKGPDVTIEGPRLGDLTVSSSAYGAAIAIGYGTVRIAGNIIWSSGIREEKNVSETSSGGGQQIHAKYPGNGAEVVIAMCEVPLVQGDGSDLYTINRGPTV